MASAYSQSTISDGAPLGLTSCFTYQILIIERGVTGMRLCKANNSIILKFISSCSDQIDYRYQND